MRIFVAIDLPSELRLHIAELIDNLRSGAANVRWTKPESLHITLKFLGEVPPAQIEAIKTSLASVRLDAPVSLKIEGAGFYPNERSPRIVWLGVAGGPPLQELSAGIEKILQPVGFASEHRPYSPHLTLGRVRQPGKLDVLRQSLGQQRQTAFGSFNANHFFLYESRLSTAGSLYLKLAGFEFAPSR